MSYHAKIARAGILRQTAEHGCGQNDALANLYHEAANQLEAQADYERGLDDRIQRGAIRVALYVVAGIVVINLVWRLLV